MTSGLERVLSTREAAEQNPSHPTSTSWKSALVLSVLSSSLSFGFAGDASSYGKVESALSPVGELSAMGRSGSSACGGPADGPGGCKPNPDGSGAALEVPGVDDGGDVLTGSERCRLLSCSETAVVGDRTRVVGGVDGCSSYKRVRDRSS